MKESKIIALVLIVLLVLSSFSLAREKRGVEVVVTKKDGTQVSGELIAVKKNSLLLLADAPAAGTDLAVALDVINKLKIKWKSKALTGMAWGLLAGGVCGYVIGLGGGDDPPGFMSSSASDKANFGAAGFGVLGMLLGGLAGSAVGMDQTIVLGDVPESELGPILELLTKGARIKQIQ